MEILDINAERRISIGTSSVKKIKRDGFVPGVIYQGGESKSILMKEDEVRHIIKHDRDVFLNVNLDGEKIKTRVQEVQRDPITNDILHVDLMPMKSSDEIKH